MSNPGTPASNPEGISLTRALKAVSQYLGLLGGGGAGFAGLAFGIGYLATKHHDAMLGMPTTTTDYTTYVRTGALFFTQSLHDFVAALATLVSPGRAVITIVAASAVLVGVPLLMRWLALRPGRKWLRWLPLLAANALFLYVSLRYLPRHLAPLDAGNKNLLFEQRALSGPAADVNQRLRDPDGEALLHGLYGFQWVSALGLALAAFILYRWRRGLADDATPGDLESVMHDVNDWGFRPATYVVIGAIVATTPANYGVLAMSTSLPCVQLYAVKNDGKTQKLGGSGFLVSDLSSEKGEIAVLRWDADLNSYFVDFHPRTALKQIEVAFCPVHNPVSRVLAPPAS